MRYTIFALFICVLLNACVEYKTQYEGPYTDGQPVAISYEIVFVENGALRMANPSLSRVKTLLPPSNISKASINFRHDRIAYKTATGNILVVDTTGIAIASVPNSSNVIWFDWHANNETLYMLNPNNTLSFYGPPIQGATSNFVNRLPGYGTNNLGIKSVAIKANGTMIIGVNPETFTQENGVWVLEPNGQNTRLRTQFNTSAQIRLSALDYVGMVISQGPSSSWVPYFLFSEPGNHGLNELNGNIKYLAPSPRDENEAVGWSPVGKNELFLRKAQRSLPLSGVISDLDW
jgi:hypothetical protein